MMCSDTMDLSVVLAASFSFLMHTPACEASIVTRKCADIGLVSLNSLYYLHRCQFRKKEKSELSLNGSVLETDHSPAEGVRRVVGHAMVKRQLAQPCLQTGERVVG